MKEHNLTEEETNKIEERFDQYIKDTLEKTVEEYKLRKTEEENEMPIKKEWLLDRAEYMLAEIEAEIDRLRTQNAKDRIRIERMENEFRDSEEDFYIAATDAGLDENEARLQQNDLYAEHINDPTLVSMKQHLEYNRLKLVALRQDKEIYRFYLTKNMEQRELE